MHVPILRAFAVLAIMTSTTMISARPIGERQVIVNEQQLATLSIEDQQAVRIILYRLEEILATDRSQLDRSERSALRSEFRALKGEMEQYNAGGTVIYFSTGAIILILILLIILL